MPDYICKIRFKPKRSTTYKYVWAENETEAVEKSIPKVSERLREDRPITWLDFDVEECSKI